MNEETPKAAERPSDKISPQEAAAARLLLREDIRKYQYRKAQLLAEAAAMDVYIADAETGLADLDRREAGVMYPEPPKKPESPKPGGQPVQAEPVKPQEA